MTGYVDDLSPAMRAEIAERTARRDALAAEHGMPERIDARKALGLAIAGGLLPDTTVTPDDVWAGIHRDQAAASAWLESDRVHNGHPTLATVPLSGGRVIGILDLRPALEAMRKQQEGK